MDRAKGQVCAAIRAVMPPDAAQSPALAILGLAALPARIGQLSPGMIYSLACDQQAVRLPLAAGALAASLRTGKQCVLVTPSDPAMFLRKARLAGFELGQHARHGELAIFQLAAEADKHMFRAGAEGFLRELEQHFASRGAFMVFDQADPVFMLSDPSGSTEAAQTYLRWIAAYDHTLLALFAPSAMAPRDYLALRRIAENFAGFAVARSTCGGGSLEIRHWFAVDGASPRETFDLRLQGGGELSTADEPLGQDELPPVESVIYVRGAMNAAPAGCRDWQEAPSIAEALQAARRSEAATLLLPFRQDADFPSLCRAVAALRAMARPRLRVVVRECRLRLRAAQVLALMRLGASSVIPTDLSDVGAKRMIELLRGTRFARSYETELQQVQDEAAYLHAGASTPVPMFCEAVEGLLAAADGFDFESCLVSIAAESADPGKLLGLARQAGRDLAGVAHHERAWLFLFGCPQSAVPAVMQRLLGPVLAEARCKWSAEHRPERILLELEGLRGE